MSKIFGAVLKALFQIFGKQILHGIWQVTKSICKWIWHLIVSAYHFIVTFAHNHPIIFAIICAIIFIRLIVFIKDEILFL